MGKLAVEKTKEQYPKADIIDYLHIGRKPKTVQITVEKFKLWLREDGKEYGVFVDVEFETKTEKFIKVSFQKIDNENLTVHIINSEVFILNYFQL